MQCIDETRQLLRSEKLTDRNKGKNCLAILLTLDKNHVLLNSKHWQEIVISLMEIEKCEIEKSSTASAKRYNLLDTTNLHKAVLKHAIVHMVLSEKKCHEIIKHSCVIVYENTIDKRIRDIHCNILSDLLEQPKFSIVLKLDTIVLLFNVLKELSSSMKTFAGDGGIPRLFRCWSRAISTTDHVTRNDLLNPLCEWFSDICLASQGNSIHQSATCSMLCDCYCFLLPTIPNSSAETVFRSIRPLLSLTCQLLYKIPVREHSRESLLRFLLSYFQFSRNYLSTDRLLIDVILPPRSTGNVTNVNPLDTVMLLSMWNSFMDRDFLKSLVLYVQNINATRRQSKDMNITIALEESKIRLNLEVASHVCIWLQINMLHYHSTDVSTPPLVDDLDFGGLGESSSSSKRRKVDVDRYASSPVPPEKLPFHSLLTCLQQEVRPLHSSVSIQKDLNALNSTVVTSAANTSSGKPTELLLLEGYLLLFVNILHVSYHQYGAFSECSVMLMKQCLNGQLSQQTLAHPVVVKEVANTLSDAVVSCMDIIENRIKMYNQQLCYIAYFAISALVNVSNSCIDFFKDVAEDSVADLTTVDGDDVVEIQRMWPPVISKIVSIGVSVGAFGDTSHKNNESLLVVLCSYLNASNIMSPAHLLRFQQNIHLSHGVGAFEDVRCLPFENPVCCMYILNIICKADLYYDVEKRSKRTTFSSVFQLANFATNPRVSVFPNEQVAKKLHLLTLCLDWLCGQISLGGPQMNAKPVHNSKAFLWCLRQFCDECVTKLFDNVFGSSPQQQYESTKTTDYGCPIDPWGVSCNSNNLMSNYTGTVKHIIAPSCDGLVMQHDDVIFNNRMTRKTKLQWQHCCERNFHEQLNGIDLVQSTLNLLDVAKDHLVTALTVELKHPPSVDYFTNWQTVCMLITNFYLCLSKTVCCLKDSISGDSNNSDSRDVSMKRIMESILESTWLLILHCLQTVQSRIGVLAFSPEFTAFLKCMENNLVLVRTVASSYKGAMDVHTDKLKRDSYELFSSIFHAYRAGLLSSSGGGFDRATAAGRISQTADDDLFSQNDAGATAATAKSASPDFERNAMSCSRGIRMVFNAIEPLNNITAMLSCLVHMIGDEQGTSFDLFSLLRHSSTARPQSLFPLENVDEDRSKPYWVASEHTLFIARSLCERQMAYPVFDAAIQFIMNSAWDTEWMSWGYSYLLTILSGMFRSNRNPVALSRTNLDICMSIIFATDDSVAVFPSSAYHAPFMQIVCGCNFLTYCSTIVGNDMTDTIKRTLAAYMLDSVTHADCRVRKCAVYYLPTLLQYFAKPSQIYQSFVEVTTVELPSSAMTMTSAIGIALFGKACPQGLLKHALLKILCLLKRDASSSDSNNENWVLLEKLLKFISNSVGYKSAKLMVEDVLGFILLRWLTNFEEADVGLSNFPYQILGVSTYADFVNQYSHTIVPLICQLDHGASSRRWGLFLDVCAHIAGGTSDADVAKVVSANIVCIKSFHSFFLTSLDPNAGKIVRGYDYGEHVAVGCDAVIQGNEMLKFVYRLINADEAEELIRQRMSDVIMNVFLYLCTDWHSFFEGENVVSRLIHVLFELLHGETGTGTIPTKEEKVHFIQANLSNNCNLCYILFELKTHFQETNLNTVRERILSCLSVLVDLGGKQNGTLCFAYLSLFSSMFRCQFYQDRNCFRKICIIFNKYVEVYCTHLSTAGSKIIHGSSDLVFEVFTECLVLLEGLQLRWVKGNESPIYGGNQSSSLLDRQLNSSCLDTSRSGQIVTVALEEVLSYVRDSMEHLLETCLSLEGKYRAVVNTLCFPVPLQFIDNVDEATREILTDQSYIEHSQSYTKTELFVLHLTSFVSFGQQYLSGYVKVMSSLWFHIIRLKSYVTDAVGSDAASYNCSDNGHFNDENLWQSHSELMGNIVSVLIGLCKIPDVSRYIQREILDVIGRLGMPDISAVSQSNFPHRFDEISALADGDSVLLKKLMVVKVYGLMWGDDLVVARAAYDTLKTWNSLLCFTSLAQWTTVRMKPYLMENCRYSEVIMNQLFASKSPIQSFPKLQLQNPSPVGVWNPSTWNTTGVSFSVWVRTLVISLLQETKDRSLIHLRYISQANLNENSTSVSTSRANKIVSSPNYHESDVFLYSLSSLCQMRSDIATDVFPLSVLHLLLPVIDNPIELKKSHMYKSFSKQFSDVLLHPSCSLPSAVRLACQTLMFLCRFDVARFLVKSDQLYQSRKGKKVTSSTSSSSSKGVDVGNGARFSVVLKVDLLYVADAATRCGLICSGFYFLELHADLVGEFDALKPTHLTTMSLNNSSKSSGDINASTILTYILTRVHDPDSVHGMPHIIDPNSQALLYRKTGRWLEALYIYDNMLGSDVQTASDVAVSNPYIGIATCMHELGLKNSLGVLLSNPEYKTHMQHSNAMLDKVNVQSIIGDATWMKKCQNADMDLQSWNSDMETTAAGAGNEFDYVNGTIVSALSDLKGHAISSGISKLRACRYSLVSELLQSYAAETGHAIAGHLSQVQKLVEVEEVCELRQSEGVCSFENLWRSRWSGRILASNAANDSILSLRVLLLENLISDQTHPNKYAKLPDLLECMSYIQRFIRTKATAHACGGLLASLKQIVEANVANIEKLEGASTYTSTVPAGANVACLDFKSFSKLQITFHEVMLLYKKGLTKMAIAALDENVIDKLKRMKLSRSTTASATATTRYDALFPKDSAMTAVRQNEVKSDSFCDLLSESYRNGGGWRITNSSATGPVIISDFLHPAVEYACSTQQRILAHKSLGDFNAKLHYSMKSKIDSNAWKDSQRLAGDRLAELTRSKAVQEAQYKKEFELYQSKKQTVSFNTVMSPSLKNLTRHIAWLQKEISMDTRERDSVLSSVGRYLLSALNEYSKVLSLSSDSYLETIFQVINMWFSNIYVDNVSEHIQIMVKLIPSYKFVPLTYQIFSRLGQVNSIASSNGSSPKSFDPHDDALRVLQFNNALFDLAFKLCSDHPHHTLPQLFALVNEDVSMVDGSSMTSATVEGTATSSNVCIDRIKASNRVLTKMRTNSDLAEIIDSLGLMLKSYIKLAGVSVDKLCKAGKTSDISFKDIQHRDSLPDCVNGLTYRPVILTTTPNVHKRNFPSLNAYDTEASTVRINRVLNKFSITESGISRPKIIICEGSDGLLYKQLVKGGDDTRQDAVMEQVFQNLNRTLDKDSETRKRQLSCRTYKIIPLTRQCGIIEWVENSIPIGSYLTDRGGKCGAHSRYFPSDYSHDQCRDKLKDIKDVDDKLTAFRDICQHFKPALHYFFLEKYSDAASWLACRTAYTRSVACSSIVGYILGIGDRHSHNILLDLTTAEVIHIDFGIVFEQGKVLSTPETVPFRLTRDIIDGMGCSASGYEGTFKRCCEEVLRVLKSHILQLLTILEVVIYDPLYKWSLSPLQARLRQQKAFPSTGRTLGTVTPRKGSNHKAVAGLIVESDGLMSEQEEDRCGDVVLPADETGSRGFDKDAAERTLSRIRNKLHGFEDSASEALSLAGQVEYVLNEARDDSNLSRIFAGWAPWL